MNERESKEQVHLIPPGTSVPAAASKETLRPVVRSFAQGGWWLTDHPFLWNCVDDFGNCVPINPFTLVCWINDSHKLH